MSGECEHPRIRAQQAPFALRCQDCDAETYSAAGYWPDGVLGRTVPADVAKAQRVQSLRDGWLPLWPGTATEPGEGEA